MPRITDSDNMGEGQTIQLTCTVDCPKCETPSEAIFDTGKFDEDGLADLSEGDLVTSIKCPNCDHSYDAEYDGWINYGEA